MNGQTLTSACRIRLLPSILQVFWAVHGFYLPVRQLSGSDGCSNGYWASPTPGAPLTLPALCSPCCKLLTMLSLTAAVVFTVFYTSRWKEGEGLEFKSSKMWFWQCENLQLINCMQNKNKFSAVNGWVKTYVTGEAFFKSCCKDEQYLFYLFSCFIVSQTAMSRRSIRII